MSRYLPILAGIAVWLALAGLATLLLYYADAKARLEAGNEVRTALGEARDEIDRRLETALAVPETLAAVIAAEQRVDKATFEAIASRLVRANPSIRNVALAPNGVITLVHPRRGNEAVLGLRYADVPTQAAAVRRAIRSRRTVVTGPIPLVQGGTGLLSRTPVFLRGSGGRDTRYWGIVALAVDVDPLFVDIERVADRNGLSIAVRRTEPDAPTAETFFGDPAVFAAAPVAMDYPLPGGGRWELAAVPREGWASVRAPLYVRVPLHILAALLGLLTYRLLASQGRDRMLAGRDALTGLLNRKSFDLRLDAAMQQGRVRSSALVLIDLDRFKPVNDNYGHRAGDLVLQQVAERMQQALHGDDSAYRLGGDEFALLLQGERSTRELFHLVERVVELIRQPVVLPDRRSVSVGASTGVAVFPSGEEPERAAEVFDRADRALYRCKAQANRAPEPLQSIR
ncbi:diguanylate cyclase domain-containing protein [Lysobacter solisilvae (ex Woo and Kim 2020)]|uniref:Sensor domain-containing diguanylate cyclase n=1 Tax=Agrilutibacter terrestris TaxID=2865112 RepID=A0A7H0G0Q8_9GAMM|nr:diguanylate cyclase [Lysobacter terrestris]QNP41874.1 sensor domain-containing diguanylate cyclase [Lysobacter terrestris]